MELKCKCGRTTTKKYSGVEVYGLRDSSFGYVASGIKKLTETRILY